MIDLKKFVSETHSLAKEKGFWDIDKNVPTSLMLIVSELGEACEAHRCGEIDHMKEEIADTIIRLADFCGRHNIDIEAEILKKHKKNKNRPYLHGKKY